MKHEYLYAFFSSSFFWIGVTCMHDIECAPQFQGILMNYYQSLLYIRHCFLCFLFFKKGTRWRKYWCKTMFTTPMNKSTRTKCFLTMSPHYFWEWRVLEIIKKGTLESGFTFYLKVYGTAIFSYIFCERKVFFNCSYSLWILQTVRPGFAVYFYISE